MNLQESIRRILREEFDDLENMDWITKSKASLKNSVIFFEPMITKEEYDKVIDIIKASCNYDELYCYTGSLRDLNPFNGYGYLHHLVITKDGKILYGGANRTSEDSLYNTKQDLENYIINNDIDFDNPSMIDGREYFNL